MLLDMAAEEYNAFFYSLVSTVSYFCTLKTSNRRTRGKAITNVFGWF